MRIHPSLVIRCRRYTLTLVLGYIVTSTQRRLPCFSALHSARQLYCHTGMQIIGLERTRLESELRQPIPHFCAHGLRHYKPSDHCIAFANDIIAQGGKLYIYNPPRGRLIRSHSL
jgi:integrase